jgi:cell division protein FtsI (penicillin-binding protein 3)
MIRHAKQSSLNLRPPVPDPDPDRAARIFLEGRSAQALETGRTRLLAAGVVFAMAFFVVGWRLVDIAAVSVGSEPRIAAALPAAAARSGRADIVDRNGVVLATSLPTASLYANAKQVRDPAAAAARLVEVLPGLSRTEVAAKLATGRAFIWLKRNLTPREHYRVNRLGIPGLHFESERRRFYPHGTLTAHSVGFTDVDDRGLSGVERSFDEVLRGRGAPLALSLDLRVQYAMTQELSAAMTEFGAVGAAGMVMDVANGEVLAMVSLPSFDPERPGAAPADSRFNRASLGLYEMGSVFKIFTAAMALDEGVVTLEDGYDTSKPIRVARFTINDFHPKNRWLSVPEIFMYSSNIGAARMAMDTGIAAQRSFLERLGLTRPASIELREVGTFFNDTATTEIYTMTIAYGHGLAVSPLQFTSAAAAVVNGGVFRPATLLKRAPGAGSAGVRSAGAGSEGIRIMDRGTSLKMRRLMRLAVRRGTGREANAEGYLVGGKTGTADKLVGGRYARNARIASFLGAFPMDAPRYVVFAMVDEPKGIKRTQGYATGGWVAAPVVRAVIERIGPMLGVAPVRADAEQDDGEGLLVQARARARTVAAN